MTIKHTVGSTSVATPGVYSTYNVVGSFVSISPSARNVLIIGEAEEGEPANLVDLRSNYYTSMIEVIEKYKSGPIVDACQQLFTKQPDRAFSGTVGYVYIAKTNQSKAASRTIDGNYGIIRSSIFGESGNFIRTFINRSSFVAPSTTVSVLIQPVPYSIDFAIHGVKKETVTIDPSAISDIISDINSVVGVTAAGQVLSLSGNLVITASDDSITVTGASITPPVGSTLYIAHASVFSSSFANSGSYIVTHTGVQIVAKKLLSCNASGIVNYIQPVAISATGAIPCITPVVISSTQNDKSASTIEISSELLAVNNLISNTPVAVLSLADMNIGSVKAVVQPSGELQVNLIDTTFQSKPVLGSVVHIHKTSPIAGSSQKNVGLYTITQSNNDSVNLQPIHGTIGEDVAVSFLAGKNIFTVYASNVNKVITGIEERAVFTASSSSSREVRTVSGGNMILGLSFKDSTANFATVSIDNKRRIIIKSDTLNADIVLPLGKFETVKQLAIYLSSLQNVRAEVIDTNYSQYPTTILDEAQDVDILTANVHSGRNGIIKADYFLFKDSFSDSSLRFDDGGLVFKSGLPTVDTNHRFLTDGALGGTTNENIAEILNNSLFLPVRMVIPLFSRDSREDINDVITSPLSNYTIEGIISLVSAHASTASSDKNRKERIALVSYSGDIDETKRIARSIDNHLVSGLTFQQVLTADGKGQVRWMLPYISQCMIAAGRSQSMLGTPMLRKSFSIINIRHIGNKSLYSGNDIKQTFNWQDYNELEEAITNCLVVFGERSGRTGIVQLSPDLSTVSGVNDPKAFYYERQNVIFLHHELMQTCRDVLDNYIGSRTSEVRPENIRTSLSATLNTAFVASRAIITYSIDRIDDLGNGYRVFLRYKPTEAIEFITLDVTITRDL